MCRSTSVRISSFPALAEFAISAMLAPSSHWTQQFSVGNYCDLLLASAGYTLHSYCQLPPPDCAIGGCSGHGLCAAAAGGDAGACSCDAGWAEHDCSRSSVSVAVSGNVSECGGPPAVSGMAGRQELYCTDAGPPGSASVAVTLIATPRADVTCDITLLGGGTGPNRRAKAKAGGGASVSATGRGGISGLFAAAGSKGAASGDAVRAVLGSSSVTFNSSARERTRLVAITGVKNVKAPVPSAEIAVSVRCRSSDRRFDAASARGGVGFEHVEFPTMESLSPQTSAYIGQQVTIQGTGFGDAPTISVGGVVVSGPPVLRTVLLNESSGLVRFSFLHGILGFYRRWAL